MYVTLILITASWSGVTGLLVPRAAYRFAVAPETPWREHCPDGHPIIGPAGGWLGRARCDADGARHRGRAGLDAQMRQRGLGRQPPLPLVQVRQ
ncbi:hypothetical protein [Streptomyces sp. ISL-100]|uniref:hypothetical protein n=1 Tax=Streptomyces sp. ISL-100 TaxID=2819173 RepID=UPI001BE6E834|nr:hypothetical protein [Streptomyces sp. ISL-100]